MSAMDVGENDVSGWVHRLQQRHPKEFLRTTRQNVNTEMNRGNSLVVWWLGLSLPRAQVQLLVRELRPQAAQPKNTNMFKKCVVPLYSFPGGSGGEESARSAGGEGRPGLGPWAGKIPWRRKWQPTPVFLPGESHGQRSLADYSPWCRRATQLKQLSTL